MTIMGLIVSVVTLSTGSLSAVFGRAGDDSAEAVADELLVMMNAALSQAVLGGEPMALAFASSTTAPTDVVAVTWLNYGRTAGGSLGSRQALWQPVSAQNELRDVHLPATVASALTIEGERANVQALADNPGLPALVFYPTGDSTAFEWSLSQGEQAVILSNTTTGLIERRQP
jgi:hypothetical protein